MDFGGGENEIRNDSYFFLGREPVRQAMIVSMAACFPLPSLCTLKGAYTDAPV